MSSHLHPASSRSWLPPVCIIRPIDGHWDASGVISRDRRPGWGRRLHLLGAGGGLRAIRAGPAVVALLDPRGERCSARWLRSSHGFSSILICPPAATGSYLGEAQEALGASCHVHNGGAHDTSVIVEASLKREGSPGISSLIYDVSVSDEWVISAVCREGQQSLVNRKQCTFMTMTLDHDLGPWIVSRHPLS